MHLQKKGSRLRKKKYQLIYYYSVKLFFALIKNKTQTAVINILNLHIVLRLDVSYVLYIRLNQNVQVQYVYISLLFVS